MRSVQQGLKDEGLAVPITELCQWFGVAYGLLPVHQYSGQGLAGTGQADKRPDRS